MKSIYRYFRIWKLKFFNFLGLRLTEEEWDEIPNAVTRETLEKLEQGKDVYQCDTLEELWDELETND